MDGTGGLSATAAAAGEDGNESDGTGLQPEAGADHPGNAGTEGGDELSEGVVPRLLPSPRCMRPMSRNDGVSPIREEAQPQKLVGVFTQSRAWLGRVCEQVKRGLRGQCLSESLQQLRPIATPCAAVHTGECCRLSGGQSLKPCPPILRVGVIVHPLPERFARPQNVRLRNGREIRTSLGEQIAAEQGAGSFFRQKPTFPRVR